MSGIINGISTIINTIKMVFDIIMSVFSTLVMVFRYLLEIVNLVFVTLSTLPSWIKAFAVITVSISIGYFLIGRNAGKSD